MTTQELVDLYFERNPPVISLVKNCVVELADTILRDNPDASAEQCIASLAIALKAVRQLLRKQIEAGLTRADSVTLNYGEETYTFRVGHLEMISPSV